MPTKFKIKHIPSLFKETYIAWNKDKPWRLSAVVAYYSILSLPALLVIIINTVGAIWGPDIVAGRLTDEFSSTLGPDAAESIKSIITNVQSEDKSVISTIIGIGALLFGATGVFFHLHISLNEIWGVKSNPDIRIKKIIFDRVKSFGFVLIIGFLLLISFIATAMISALTGYIKSLFPDLIIYLVYAIDIGLSLTIISVLFALIFKYLPDVNIQWKAIWVGAVLTAILFVLGKFLLGLYFGQLNPGSTYGAAGSIVLILLWVSYSCLILFFGAEFTWVFARRYGMKIHPNENAVFVKTKVVEVEN
ncbi:MAG: YihY/virulence factor BrkB family protein [Chitinophagales bacterium]